MKKAFSFMKTSIVLILIITNIILGIKTYAQYVQIDRTFRMNFRALIDGSDYVHVKRNTVWYVHRNYQKPDYYNGYSTYINHKLWKPDWSNYPKSDKYKRLIPPLTTAGTSNVRLKKIEGRGTVTLTQAPAPENNYEAVFLIDDDPQPGSEWYEVMLTWDWSYPPPPAPPISYKTVGNATIINSDANEFQLTPNNYWQVGGVWAQTPLDLQKCFKIKAQLNFGADDFGADGIVFILSKKDNVLGPAGEYLGYQGITSSFEVEFDTWYNADLNDPIDDHLGFMQNGNPVHTNNNLFTLPNIETGQYYDVTFTGDVNAKVFTVNFLGKDYSYPLDSVISNVEDTSKVYFGFTAATGAASNLQLVKIISVENDCPSISTSSVSPLTKLNDELAVYITPNPSQTEFKMELKGTAGGPISFRLIDVSGKLIKTYNKLSANQILRFGSELHKGIYFAEVSQNNQRKLIKLIKL